MPKPQQSAKWVAVLVAGGALAIGAETILESKPIAPTIHGIAAWNVDSDTPRVEAVVETTVAGVGSQATIAVTDLSPADVACVHRLAAAALDNYDRRDEIEAARNARRNAPANPPPPPVLGPTGGPYAEPGGL